MAIEQGTQTVAITTQERTWRLNIETAQGADPVVTVFREVVRSAADGTVISKESGASASRNLSDVATEQQPFTPSVAGKITGAELAELIAVRADMWRTADIAAAEAAEH